MMIGKCVRINTCATLALWKEAHCSSVEGAQFLSTVDRVYTRGSRVCGVGVAAGTAGTRRTHTRARGTALSRPRWLPAACRASRALGRSGLCRLRALRQGRLRWKLENQTVRSNASVLWGAGTARLLASA